MASSTFSRQPLTLRRLDVLKATSNIRMESDDGSERSTSADSSEEEQTPLTRFKKGLNLQGCQERVDLLSSAPDATEEEKQPESDDDDDCIGRSQTPVLLEDGSLGLQTEGFSTTRFAKVDAVELFAVLPFDESPQQEPVQTHYIENCPKGHGLYEFLTPSIYSCDGCQQSYPTGTKLYGCRLCNFDACVECVMQHVAKNCEGTQHRCPRGHGSIPFRWKDTRICDRCRKHMEPGRRMMSCTFCDYDECLTCFRGQEPTYYEILEISPESDVGEIERAAWNLSRSCRRQCVKAPDNMFLRLDAISRFQEVAVAFATLGDPELRQEYDELLANPEQRKEREKKEMNKLQGEHHKPWELYSPLFSPPEISKTKRSAPSFKHAAYTAVAGTALAPAHALLYGTVACAEGMVDGTKAMFKGVKNGGFGLAEGVRILSSGESLKKGNTKVFVEENIRVWHFRQPSRPIREISRVVTEPIYGVATGSAYIVSGVILGAAVSVGGTAYGVGFNLAAARQEFKEAWRCKRKNRQPTETNSGFVAFN